MKSEKSNLISLRLEDNLMHRIESCAQFENATKSDFIRKALIESTKYTEIFPIRVPTNIVDFIQRTIQPLKFIKFYPAEIPDTEEKSPKKSPDGSKKKTAETALNIVVKMFPDIQPMSFSGEMVKILLDELEIDQIKKVAIKCSASEYALLKSSLLNDEDILEFISDELLKGQRLIPFFFYILRYLTNEILSEKGRKWFEKCQITKAGEVVTFVGKHKGGIKFSYFFMFFFENFMSFVPFHRQEEPVVKGDSIKLMYKLLVKNEEPVNLPKLIQEMNKKMKI